MQCLHQVMIDTKQVTVISLLIATRNFVLLVSLSASFLIVAPS